MATSADNITRKKGDTYPIVATITKDAAAFNLTGATEVKIGVAQKKVLAAGENPLFVVLGSVSDGPAGKLSFPVSGGLESLAQGKYYAEITLTLGGYIYTTATFNYVVEPQIISS